MKSPARFLTAFAAICFAFVGSASAQLVTYSTHAGYEGGLSVFGTSSPTRFQTFSNVLSVHSMTFNFFYTHGGSSTERTIQATFGEWNGSSFVSGTTVALPDILVPATTTTHPTDPTIAWSHANVGEFSGSTYQAKLDLSLVSSSLTNPVFGYVTDSAKTYAMLLTRLGASTPIGLGLNEASTFAYGSASAASAGSGADFVFSQISITPGNELVPVPESSTIAAIAGAVLVGGLVIVRTRQRRQNETAPLAIA